MNDQPSLHELNAHLFADMLPATHGTQPAPEPKPRRKAAAEQPAPDAQPE